MAVETKYTVKIIAAAPVVAKQVDKTKTSNTVAAKPGVTTVQVVAPVTALNVSKTKPAAPPAAKNVTR
jgi:hypothetical protein